MRVYGRSFSVDPPLKIKYRMFRSIKNKSTNTGFVLFTGLVKNPLISPQFWNSMLDRYDIGDFRVSVLIIPMKQIQCFHNPSAADTDAECESAQKILSVVAHVIKSPFSTFVP